jgi:DUF3037 family protein
MQPVADSDSTYSCATLRYMVDDRRGVSVPIGVVLWNEAENYIKFRLPREDERVGEIPPAEADMHLQATRAQIEAWRREKHLPYLRAPVQPLSREWWEHVQRLLGFRIRLDSPRPIDCQEPEEEIDALFDAMVQPKVSRKKQTERVDSAVKRALGPQLSKRLKHGKKVPGWKDALVSVLRAASDARVIVVVEAISLASRTATKDADELASRLQRIREGGGGREVRFVLGYIASPEGLNGEAVMKDWIEHKTGCSMYDLIRNRQKFHDEAEDHLEDVNDSLGVFGESKEATVR